MPGQDLGFWVGAALVSLGLSVGCRDGTAGPRTGGDREKTVVSNSGRGRKKAVLVAARPTGTSPWTTGASRQEAITRVRAAELPLPSGHWELWDLRANRKGVSGGAETPAKIALGWPGAAVLGYSALRTGHLEASEAVSCFGDRILPAGHGPVDLVRALALGCRSFFQVVASRVPWDDFLFGVRMAGLRSPRRPADLIARWRLAAEGVGFQVSWKDLVRFGRWLARRDPGDEAKEQVLAGCVEAVRSGVLKSLNMPRVQVAAVGGDCGPHCPGCVVIAWVPWDEPDFLILVETAQGCGRAEETAHEILSLLLGPRPTRTRTLN